MTTAAMSLGWCGGPAVGSGDGLEGGARVRCDSHPDLHRLEPRAGGEADPGAASDAHRLAACLTQRVDHGPTDEPAAARDRDTPPFSHR